MGILSQALDLFLVGDIKKIILQPLSLSLTYTDNEKEGERRGIGTREIEGSL